jgi:hypothetical protein
MADNKATASAEAEAKAIKEDADAKAAAETNAPKKAPAPKGDRTLAAGTWVQLVNGGPPMELVNASPVNCRELRDEQQFVDYIHEHAENFKLNMPLLTHRYNRGGKRLPPDPALAAVDAAIKE